MGFFSGYLSDCGRYGIEGLRCETTDTLYEKSILEDEMERWQRINAKYEVYSLDELKQVAPGTGGFIEDFCEKLNMLTPEQQLHYIEDMDSEDKRISATLKKLLKGEKLTEVEYDILRDNSYITMCANPEAKLKEYLKNPICSATNEQIIANKGILVDKEKQKQITQEAQDKIAQEASIKRAQQVQDDLLDVIQNPSRKSAQESAQRVIEIYKQNSKSQDTVHNIVKTSTKKYKGLYAAIAAGLTMVGIFLANYINKANINKLEK